MADIAAPAVPRGAAAPMVAGKISAGAVIAAAVGQAGVGLLTSTAYPQLAVPASSAFGPSGAVLTALHVVMLVGIAGLALSPAAGQGVFPRLAYGITLLGLAGQAVAEAVLRMDFVAGNTLFTYAVPVMALGFLLLGAAVLRARNWRGWHRATPLLCGIYVPAVLIPAFALAHGPSFPALTAWQLLFLLLGLAMLAESKAESTKTGGR